MTRTFAALLALGLGFTLLLPASSPAQNDDDNPPAATETRQYRGPLPSYFGKLGVGEAQRETLYAVDAEYAARIEALQKQIAELENERDAKLEELLTPGQKLRLKELRAEAARRAAARQPEQQAATEPAPQSPAESP